MGQKAGKQGSRPLESRIEMRTRILLILVIGIAAYLTSFPGVFIADDGFAIQDNPHIRRLWPIWEAMSKPPIHDAPVRPVVYLSLAINYAFGGLNVWGYHAFNLAIHILAACLIFEIARRTLLMEVLRARLGPVSGQLALAISLIWLVHPLQTQSVTYIIQRAESMTGLFYLFTLYCVIRGAASRRSRMWYSGAIVSCLLGMGSKPIMATAPAMVLLYDRHFLSASFAQALRARKSLYIGLAATWSVLVLILLVSPHGPETSAGFASDYTPVVYALNQAPVLLHYLKLTVWPASQCLDYLWPAAEKGTDLILPGLVMGALAVLTCRALVARWALGFLGAWFFIILAPTSSIIPVDDLLVEHRMYLPLAALVSLAVIMVWTLLSVTLPKPRLRRAVATALVVCVVGTLGFLTAKRNKVYWSEEIMFRDVVATRPANYRAHYALGRIHFMKGRMQDAVRHYEEAIRLNPEFPFPYTSLGVVLIRQGRLRDAIPVLERATELHPDFAGAFSNLGAALAGRGRIEEAIAHFERAVELDPNNTAVRENLERIRDDIR